MTRKLKIACQMLIAIAALNRANAQVHPNDNLWFNNGAEVYVGNTALLTVQGDITNNKAGISGITHFNNNGFVWIQGNMYGDNTFQQAGTGTLRLQNKTSLYTAPYASENYQVITGGYEVHGDQSVIGTANDGSIYNLQLDNSNGMVFIADSTDVRNSVDFKPASVTIDGATIAPNGRTNTIQTYNPGNGVLPATMPSNGASYSNVFGMMNNAAGMAGFINCSSNLMANTNTLDSGYIQGKLRRAISTLGGAYGFPMGLESNSGTTNARGIQYAILNFLPNNYNVVTGYFQQGSDNTVSSPSGVCSIVSNFLYYGTSNHGEWVFKPSTVATDTYSITIYPQDYGTTTSPLYFITKDNLVPSPGVQSCLPSPLGLSVSQLSGFSEFGFAGGTSNPLPIVLKSFEGKAFPDCNAGLNWSVASVKDLNQFIVIHSNDGKDFSEIGKIKYDSSRLYSFMYHQNEQDGYYRLNMINMDGSSNLSDIVHVKTDCGQELNNYIIKPNPVYNTLYIENLNEGVKQILLVNIIGNTVYTSKTSDKSTSIDMQAYPVGIYHLKIVDEKGMITTKKILKRTF